MATGRDIVESALRLIGALATGEAAQASEAIDGLESLNDMLDSWSNDNLIVPAVTREEFSLVGGQQSYTMGPGGDWDTTRPIGLVKALLQVSGTNPTFETEMKILSPKEYAVLTVKQTQSDIPFYIYRENTFPLETFKLFPVPQDGVNKVVLYTWKPLATFTNLSTSASLPPGYLRALKYNLAVEIAPEYGIEASATVNRVALESLAKIKLQNKQPQLMGCDQGTLKPGAVFDWRTGEE